MFLFRKKVNWGRKQQVMILSFFLITLVLLLATFSSHAQTSKDYSKKVNTDSVLCDFGNRLCNLEDYLQSSRSDNLLHPRNVMQIASLLISVITIGMVVFNIFLALYARSHVKDWNEQYRHLIEDFRNSVDITQDRLNVMRIEAEKLRDADIGARTKLESLKIETETIMKTKIEQIERQFSDQSYKMMEIITGVTEKIAEILSDRPILKRFEVIRSKALFQLGDEKEKVRSIQYIGFLGSSQDVAFLDEVYANTQYNSEIRLAALTAKNKLLESEVMLEGIRLKRFEVTRRRAFFYLGDEMEKLRSLKYIGSLGGLEDIVYLDKIATDTTESDAIRKSAEEAKTVILEREGKKIV